MENEIKLITEALTNLSDVALWAFIAYLVVCKIFMYLVCWVGGIVLAYILLKGTRQIIANAVRPIAMVKQIRDGLGIGSSGCLYDSEIDRIQKILPNLISGYRENLEEKEESK